MTERVINNLQFHQYLSTIPPQNLEAEEAILGGILLDENAFERVKNLPPEAFFVLAHQDIFRAAAALHEEGLPTDFQQVSDYLENHKLLEGVGGPNKIVQLIERTVSAVNIDRHAALVMDKYLRRQLIQAGNEVAALAGDSINETQAALEVARKKLEGILSLSSDTDKVTSEYERLMHKAEEIILYEDNPGFRFWKLRSLAKKYSTSPKTLEETYYKHLIHQESEPALTWQQLIQHEQDCQKWLMHGWLPRGSATILHGRAGDGKTQFLYFLMSLIGRGMDWQNDKHDTYCCTKKARLLIIQTDETKPEMIASLKRYAFDSDIDAKFICSWSVEEMPRLIRECMTFKPDAVLIDSLSSVSRYSTVEENDSKYAVPILTLRRLAGVFDFWCGIIHHSNREGGVRGTSALEAAASTVVKIERVQGTPLSSGKRILSFTKARSRRPATYLVEADWDNGKWKVLEEVGAGTGSRNQSTREKILQFLHSHPNIRFESKELAEELQLNNDTTRKTAISLASEGLISKVLKGGRNLYWVATEDHLIHWQGGSGVDHPMDHPTDQMVNSTPANGFGHSEEASDPQKTNFQQSEKSEENRKKGDQRITLTETTQIEYLEGDPPDRSIADPPTPKITNCVKNSKVEFTQDNCRGLSIQQPFATLITQGRKRYETRGSKTNYRGLVLIHAPQKIDKHAFNRIVRDQDDRADYPDTRVIGVAELTDCIFMDEAFINEQPEEELHHGLWEPGRYAWRLENIRPIHPTITALGALGLWKPKDSLLEQLTEIEVCDRVDDPEDPRYLCVRDAVADVQHAEDPEAIHQIINLYKGCMSDRQRAEVVKRLGITDDVSTDVAGDESVAQVDLFDKIKVGDRVRRKGSQRVDICVKKSLSPKQVKILIPCSGNHVTYIPDELEILNYEIALSLRPGLRIKHKEWTGILASRLKNQRWFVDWEKQSKSLSKLYGEPPKDAIAPESFEVV